MTFFHSWFQSRWQSLCQGSVFPNHSAFKETLWKISWTLQNHCPVWYSIIHSLSSRVYVLCSSSLPCIIDRWRACKLLYKVIWLGYEDTGDKSEWIPTSKLSHAADLVSDFHITYPAKHGPLPLSWSYCCICPLPLHISNRDFPLLISSIFCLFIFINLQLSCTFWGFLLKTSNFFSF